MKSVVLLNAPGDDAPSLIDALREAVESSTGNRAKRRLCVLSCYFDKESLISLVEAARRSVEAKRGSLTRVSIAVDVGEWIKQRVTESDMSASLSRSAGIAPAAVEFVPVQVRGRLIHPKAVALLGPAPRSDGVRGGCLIVTSANATERGTGLIESANVELAFVSTDTIALNDFENAFDELLAHKVDLTKALRQEEFLRWLALLSSGRFYHKWQGALASEVRWKLTLTKRGRAAAKKQPTLFPGYKAPVKSISKEPLRLEQAFSERPKPFPKSFWRRFAVDTLFGYWVPGPVADLVDDVLTENVKPLIKVVKERTAPDHLKAICGKLLAEVKKYRKEGWIEDDEGAVATWRAKVERFRANDELIAMRLRPYELVPDVFDADCRQRVGRIIESLEAQLEMRDFHRDLRATLARFLAGGTKLLTVEHEFEMLAALAKHALVASRAQGQGPSH